MKRNLLSGLSVPPGQQHSGSQDSGVAWSLLSSQECPALRCPTHRPLPEAAPLPHSFFLLRSASWGSPDHEPPGWVSTPSPSPLFRSSLSFVGFEKSHICSASGIPHSIIQHTKSTGAEFTHRDIIRPLTWNLGALWQPVFPNYSLIYFITLWISLCQARGRGMDPTQTLSSKGSWPCGKTNV